MAGVKFGDHPRSRGEYLVKFATHPYSAGSSPLSRGILRRLRHHSVRRGIIPALAGNTLCSRPVDLTHQDHPRSRGEYHISSLLATPRTGSSPLSRGIRGNRVGENQRAGIIPALAGNTYSVPDQRYRHRDHPRSRGEYLRHPPGSTACPGSSPLSRGILLCLCSKWRFFGIIPALAGNTDEIRLIQLHNGDHPHSRGEYNGRLEPTRP